MVKDFHPESYHGEGSRSSVPKKVMIHAVITAAGAKALSFHPKNLQIAPSLPSVLAVLKVGLRHTIQGYRSRNVANTKVFQHPFLTIHITEDKNHHHRHNARRKVARAVHLPGTAASASTNSSLAYSPKAMRRQVPSESQSRLERFPSA
jgi:hypothetical protein